MLKQHNKWLRKVNSIYLYRGLRALKRWIKNIYLVIVTEKLSGCLHIGFGPLILDYIFIFFH